MGLVRDPWLDPESFKLQAPIVDSYQVNDDMNITMNQYNIIK